MTAFDPDCAKTRVQPENGLVRSSFARSASLRSLKMGQNSPKIWNGLSFGRVFTQSGPISAIPHYPAAAVAATEIPMATMQRAWTKKNAKRTEAPKSV
jgi:hypothetical protein